MFSTFLMVMLTQVIPCSPGETSAVCSCKAGMVSACTALVGDDPEKAAELLDQVEGALDALEMAGKAKSDKDQRQKKHLQEMVQALSGAQTSSEPPNCNGQEHHLISRSVAAKLEDHLTLKGLFKPRDPRFVARARNEQAHCGYQDWHRKVDQELIDWLDRNQDATPREFLDKLREIYSRPAMKERFPNGF